MLCCTLLAVAFLFLGTGGPSAWASALASVTAILVKPTCLPMVCAAALSLVCARRWRRRAHFAAAGVLAAIVALVWVLVTSQGIFAAVVRYPAPPVDAR